MQTDAKIWADGRTIFRTETQSQRNSGVRRYPSCNRRCADFEEEAERSVVAVKDEPGFGLIHDIECGGKCGERWRGPNCRRTKCRYRGVEYDVALCAWKITWNIPWSRVLLELKQNHGWQIAPLGHIEEILADKHKDVHGIRGRICDAIYGCGEIVANWGSGRDEYKWLDLRSIVNGIRKEQTWVCNWCKQTITGRFPDNFSLYPERLCSRECLEDYYGEQRRKDFECLSDQEKMQRAKLMLKELDWKRCATVDDRRELRKTALRLGLISPTSVPRL